MVLSLSLLSPSHLLPKSQLRPLDPGYASDHLCPCLAGDCHHCSRVSTNSEIKRLRFLQISVVTFSAFGNLSYRKEERRSVLGRPSAGESLGWGGAGLGRQALTGSRVQGDV